MVMCLNKGNMLLFFFTFILFFNVFIRRYLLYKITDFLMRTLSVQTNWIKMRIHFCAVMCQDGLTAVP